MAHVIGSIKGKRRISHRPDDRGGRTAPEEHLWVYWGFVPPVMRHEVAAGENIKRRQEEGLLVGPEAEVRLTAAAGGSQTIRFERFTFQASSPAGGID